MKLSNFFLYNCSTSVLITFFFIIVDNYFENTLTFCLFIWEFISCIMWIFLRCHIVPENWQTENSGSCKLDKDVNGIKDTSKMYESRSWDLWGPMLSSDLSCIYVSNAKITRLDTIKFSKLFAFLFLNVSTFN